MTNSYLRKLASVSALLGWAAILLQLTLSLNLVISDGRGLWMGLVIYFGYFTILTNILAAVALSAQAVQSSAALVQFWRRPNVITAITGAIGIVGLVYFFILRQLWNPQGWQWLADVMLHYLMPVLFVIYWWLSVPTRVLAWRTLPTWLIYPAAYFVYVLLRGAVTGLYPYPFVDVTVLGMVSVLINAMLMLAAFSTVMVLLLVINHHRNRYSKP